MMHYATHSDQVVSFTEAFVLVSNRQKRTELSSHITCSDMEIRNASASQ